MLNEKLRLRNNYRAPGRHSKFNLESAGGINTIKANAQMLDQVQHDINAHYNFNEY